MSDREESVVTLASIKGGAAEEIFAREFQKVMQNVQDPNTPSNAKRKITLVIEVVPRGDEREELTYNISARSTLAHSKSVAGSMWIGKQGGEFVGVEFNLRQGDLLRPDNPDITPINAAKKEATH